ncbi:MAG: DUF5989 family protein [Candidatus Eremiobacteraeota bacterium]|nr:DUF5989 family protein [Candidatus Eremiobacteraeota bacterium]
MGEYPLDAPGKKGKTMEKIKTVLGFFKSLIGKDKWWLIPIIVILILLSIIIIFAESSVLAPFIYTLF